MKARGRLLRRILRALLALYPVRFRRELGRDVTDTHVDRYRGERRRGRAAAVAYSAIALADVCWGAVLEWQEGPWFEIVGVAADTRDMGLDLPAPPAVYLPFAQKPDNWGWMSWQSLVIRPAEGIEPLTLVPAVREVVLAADNRLPLQEVTTVHALYAENAARRRFAMQLLAACAGIALLIGTMGIYGVVSYAVAERRREIGIRMAPGARPSDVGLMVVRGALTLAAIGIAAGLLGAAGALRFIESLLFGIAPNDLPTFVAMAALLLAVAAVAAWLPARRAMRVDPAVTLRAE